MLYLVFCHLYAGVVADRYSFGGFQLQSDGSHFWSVISILIFALIAPLRSSSVYSCFLTLSFLFIIIPAAVLVAMNNQSLYVLTVMQLSVLSVVYLGGCLIRPGEKLGSEVPVGLSGSRRDGFWGLLCLQACILLYLAIHSGFAIRLSFMDVYDYRFDFNDSLAFPLNYLLPFAGCPLAGYLGAIAVARRSAVRVGIVCLSGILFFGLSTHKAFMFYPILAMVVYRYINRGDYLYYILVCILMLMSLVCFLSWGVVADIVGSAFANRVIFIPAQINFVYFEEFARIGPMLWSESKISAGLVDSRLAMNSVNYIGEIMTGNSEIGANVGWIASGYMNGGLLGIAGYSIIIVIIFTAISLLSRDLGGQALVAGFAVSVFTIISSNDLLVALLTGGILPMIILCWIVSSMIGQQMSREKNSDNNI